MDKKQLDNLSRDMIQCEKDGYGPWYGRWKAAQPRVKPEPVEVLPEGWKVCPYCGKPFKPKHKQQKYCEAVCSYKAQKERYREKKSVYDKA